MILIRIILINILLFNSSAEELKDKRLFISPVKIPISLSANFGELRADHFHSGLDIKTQGVTGKEVVAASSGYVYRISISPGGFGKALYLKHPSGHITVYGHLDRFIPEIEDYVKSRQYENRSFMITLWPGKERFKVRQGDLIAFSGNSGSSSGPHLHYEIRKSDEELPVNPLFYDFGIEDDIKPVFEKLFIYPAGRNSVINNQDKLFRIKVTGDNGNYKILPDNEISVCGPAGFGFKAYDLLNNSNNKFAVFSIQLKVDTLTIYNYVMNEFRFNESRYINSHIDYEIFQKEDIYVERAFVLPNDKLSLYSNLVNNGIFNFNDGRKHHIEITVSDIHNNRSTLSFTVLASPHTGNGIKTKSEEVNAVLMPYNRNNKFMTKNVSVNLPSGTLYDTLYFEFKMSPGKPGGYSDVYDIHNRYTPVHKAYNLSIRPGNVLPGKESKLLIVQLTDDMKKIPLLSSWENGYISANPNFFGRFLIDIDTVPPLISINGFSSGANLKGKSSLKIKISDDLSGIKSYEPEIDGEWALFEYDQKNNLLIYEFDSKRIRKETRHTLSLKVEDNKDNLSTVNFDFIW